MSFKANFLESANFSSNQRQVDIIGFNAIAPAFMQPVRAQTL